MSNRTVKTFVLTVLVTLGVLLALGLATVTANAAGRIIGSSIQPATNWGGCTYLVRRGDTLFSIGARHGVSPYYLAQINGLYNPNYIYAGMRLQVPCGGMPQYPPQYPPHKPPQQPCTTYSQYYVRPGDTLFGIAMRYGTTVNALRDANNLWGKVLYAGTVLKIPCPGVTPPTATPTAINPPPVMTVTSTPTVPGQVPTLTSTSTTIPGTGPTGTPTATPDGNLPPEPTATVVIGFGPDPSNVTIQAGQSVVWVNNSGETITLVSGIAGQPDGLFTSGPMPNGATFVFGFNTTGTYSYYVMEHPTMIGQVTVNAAP